MNLEIKAAKRAESRTRKRDLAAARRGNLDDNSNALAAHFHGLARSTIRFEAVKTYSLQANGDDEVDDQ